MLKDTVYLFAIEYVIAGFYPATSSLEENSRRCGCGERESVTGSVTVSGVQGQSRWCRGQETKPDEAENYNTLYTDFIHRLTCDSDKFKTTFVAI